MGVAMIFITFLQSELKNVDPSEWSKKYLSYDNMCVYNMFNHSLIGIIYLFIGAM